jgi:hypothetical protein
MTPDIIRFVRNVHERQTAGGLKPIGGASDVIVHTAAAWYRASFGLELPAEHIEICRIEDQLAEDGATLLGLGTYYEDDSEYPSYEGLMEVHERNTIDLGPQELIELGNRYGTEPWGWNLRLGCFVRSDPNRRDMMERFDSFEDMFRALFRLGS